MSSPSSNHLCILFHLFYCPPCIIYNSPFLLLAPNILPFLMLHLNVSSVFFLFYSTFYLYVVNFLLILFPLLFHLFCALFCFLLRFFFLLYLHFLFLLVIICLHLIFLSFVFLLFLPTFRSFFSL